MDFKPTPLDEIPKVYERLRTTFQPGKTLPLKYRRAQLLALARLVQENTDALLGAHNTDLGRHKLETNLPEISPIVSGAVLAANSLEDWTNPERPKVEDPVRATWSATIHKAPKGIVINIVPWNYPIVIALNPLIGAIAAGCTCVLKPSELSPTVAALIADLLPKYLDSDAYAVINGAVPETMHLLELKWDHIFFTGSNHVGRIVAAAAAKHLTPVSLELGGKSPVFVDSDNTDLEIAARRILWGRIQNAGQLCVSPDYILVERKHQDALVTAFQKAYESFWPHPNGPLDEKSELSHIINAANQARILNLIANTKGSIVLGGKSEGKRIAPVIVKDVKLDDILMEDEIYGPVVVIVPVDSVDEAIQVIRDRPTPLVIYLFTESTEMNHLFLQKTRSGQLILNDVFTQLAVYEIPFGGCGDSGYGSYLGKFSFDSFTHLRGSINVPFPAEPFLKLRYPPYTEEAYQILTGGSRLKIPEA